MKARLELLSRAQVTKSALTVLVISAVLSHFGGILLFRRGSVMDGIHWSSGTVRQANTFRVPKTHCVSFANNKLEKTTARFMAEAKNMGVFDSVTVINEDTIGHEYLINNKDFIAENQRGYGYWLYKPYVIWKTLQSLEEGDLLAYIDVGCTFNVAGRQRLVQYFSIISAAPDGLLAFSLPNEYPVGSMKERFWNKRDTLNYLGCNRTWCYDENQLVGGINFWKNTATNRELAGSWYEAGRAHNYSYITDKPSVASNYEGFREHRHDQSIFSVLVKLRLHNQGNILILPDPTWPVSAWQGDWDSAEARAEPIWAKRLKFL